MVLGVCRRVLGNEHDAEDAFQATFLVLVRKAASVVPRDLLGNWLYGVAYHTAQKARVMAGRRRARERRAATRARPATAPADSWSELPPILDRELARLPDRYRVPIVLCDLEGKTHKAAARQLGWPVGTLSGRLVRARALLARRLTRQGFTLAGLSLAALLSQEVALARVPGPLVVSTVQAATAFAAGPAAAAGVVPALVVALTEGVVRSMFLKKLTGVALGLLAAGLIAVTVGLGTFQSLAASADNGKRVRAADPQGGAAAESEQLLTEPAPVYVLARLDARKGKVAITRTVQGWKKAELIDANGQTVRGFQRALVPVTRHYDAATIRVYEVGGKPVARADLAKRLRGQVLAVAGLNGHKVEPLYLRLIKEGTLVFVLPPSDDPVRGPIGPGPMPGPQGGNMGPPAGPNMPRAMGPGPAIGGGNAGGAMGPPVNRGKGGMPGPAAGPNMGPRANGGPAGRGDGR
jgi:RNA polymerase sigma factor (sigma-70 family)